MYNNYSNYQFNPMLPPQQRLAQMEQQYPQFAMQQGARAIIVLNKEEANAHQVPIDGSITVFINKAENEIYTKGLDNNGLLSFKKYTLNDDPPTTSIPLINEGDVEVLKKEIEGLRAEIKEIKDAKQSNANDATNRTVKKQSKPDASDSDNVRE